MHTHCDKELWEESRKDVDERGEEKKKKSIQNYTSTHRLTHSGTHSVRDVRIGTNQVVYA